MTSKDLRTVFKYWRTASCKNVWLYGISINLRGNNTSQYTEIM